jgi:hypothetical protein
LKTALRRRPARDYRSAAVLSLALLGTLHAAPDAGARPATGPAPSVTVAFLPKGTSPVGLAAIDGISPGLMSAGLSTVPADQTYLDIGQGNRVFETLYDGGLPRPLGLGGSVPRREWRAVLERAASAPADIVPGLLATTLERAGQELGARVTPLAGPPVLVAANRRGRVEAGPHCLARGCPGMTVASVGIDRLRRLAARRRAGDLVIAIERPPPPRAGRQLSIGIAGRGFEGRLTSDSTRFDGLVLSTDVAPTILERFGLEAPDAMSGREIRAEGEVDAAGLVSLEDRIAAVGPRRGPVIGISLLVWVALAAVAATVLGTGGARVALALLALAGIYLPAVLLVGAATEPSQAVERLLVALGCPALAALTLAAVRGYGAVAVACAVTVVAYAIDVIAGSPLTTLSLIGPNPGIGVRFFGIGNELEAVVAALVPIGVGAGLTAAKVGSARTAAASFGIAALVGVLAFAPGRFGADVGAAIVLAVGAGVAAWVALGAGTRPLPLVIAVPVIALAAVVGIDLVLGGDAHLTGSVLEAGGLDDLADVVERRVRLSADSFADNALKPSMIACVALIVAGLALRRRIATWFEGRRAALAGLCGAIAATVAGTLANDSGAMILMIGTACVSLFVAFAWAQCTRPVPD